MCYVGACDPCQVLVNAFCFCKNTVEVVLCGSMVVKRELKAKDGVFSCRSICRKKLFCGNHDCDEICHLGPCRDCNLMPSRIRTCYCGKTSLQEEWCSCSDPILTRLQICGKPLPCRMHFCKDTCHAGDCACLVLVNQKCRCGSTSQTVECYKTIAEEKFTYENLMGGRKTVEGTVVVNGVVLSLILATFSLVIGIRTYVQ